MYRFMEQQESHAKAKWAPIPGVSKSGYYACWKREKSGRHAIRGGRKRCWRSLRKARGTTERSVYAVLSAKMAGMLPFNSRAGKPGDNAWSESFFSILKKEIIHWHFCPTREAARQRVSEYIEIYCNRQRRQKRLGYLSPIEFLSKWTEQHVHSMA